MELGVRSGTLRRWMSEYDEYGESAFPGHGSALLNSDYEIRKLQKENADLKLVGLRGNTQRQSLLCILTVRHSILLKDFSAFLDSSQFNQSMSRKGNPYYNAVMESFYMTIEP